MSNILIPYVSIKTSCFFYSYLYTIEIKMLFVSSRASIKILFKKTQKNKTKMDFTKLLYCLLIE